MAAVVPVASSVTAYGFETPAGPKTATTEQLASVVTPGHLECCFVAMAFSGTYAGGTGFSITSAILAAAIAAVKRDGQTITILDVASAAPGQEGATNAFVDAGPVTFTTSAGPATGLLYGPDEATEHANAVMGVFGAPVVFFVKFSAQAIL